MTYLNPRASLEIVLETTTSPATELSGPGTGGSEFRVILYNDDWHAMEDVVVQLMKACGCDQMEAIRVAHEAHTKGRAVCLRAGRERCHQAARILREIRLQCEVDSN